MNTCADLPAAKCSLLRSAAEEQLSGNGVSSEVATALQVKCSSSSEVSLWLSYGSFRTRKPKIKKLKHKNIFYSHKFKFLKQKLELNCSLANTSLCHYKPLRHQQNTDATSPTRGD